MRPTEDELIETLEAAGHAHHDYESNYLKGVRDEQWPGVYAAYVLGRLGDFTTPTRLARWLEEAPSEANWAVGAARHVLDELSED